MTKHLTTAWLLLLAVVANCPAAPPASNVPPCALCVPIRVNTVHDGDTATDVVIEVHVQVRYDNCWAPELTKPGGAEATASAKQAEGKHGRLYMPLNDQLDLWKLITFGRVVGEIWLDGATESESQRQVRLGFAGATKAKQPIGPPKVRNEQ